MKRVLGLASAGALGAVLAWMISEPFAHTAEIDGAKVGSLHLSLGSFYGWFAHALLGGLIAGFIAFAESIGQNRVPRALAFGFLGLALGGVLGWISDSTADRLLISSLHDNADSSVALLGAKLFWSIAVCSAIALAVYLSCGPTLARLLRIALAGIFGGFFGFLVKIVLEPVGDVLSLMRGGQPEFWLPYDVSRLGNNVFMGLLLGAAIGLADAVLSPAKLRLVLGQNEGRDFQLSSGVSRIGCREGIEVPIYDQDLEPIHAIVSQQSHQFSVQDRSSRGISVNGALVSASPLVHGDLVRVGRHTLLFTTRLGGSVRARHAVESASSPRSASPVSRDLACHSLTNETMGYSRLCEGINVLGRDPLLPISLSFERTVSNRHAQIIVHGKRALIKDLRSTNGTYLNGQLLNSEQNLAEGDHIQLGSAVFVYSSGVLREQVGES